MGTHGGGYSRALRLLRVSSGGLQRRLLRPRGEHQADAYCAKRSGRNRVCVAEHSLGNHDQSSAPIPSAHGEVTDIAEPSM